MKHILICLLLFGALLILSLPVAAQTGGDYDLSWNVIGGGGATAVTGGEYTLSGTMGQGAADAPASNGDYTLSGGFWFTAKTDQTLTFAPLADRTLGDPPFTLGATASSGLLVTFASNTPAVCTVNGNIVTLVAVGTCTLTATQPGNSGFNPAPSVERSFAVKQASKQEQTITFASLPDKLLGDPPFTVSATASSSLPVSLASATPAVCLVSGNMVTLVTTGVCSLTATQNGDATHNPATPVTQSFAVKQAGKTDQTITFASLADKILGVAPFTLNATASSGLAVSFTSTTPAVCTVSNETVTLVASGVCSISAQQDGNDTFNPAPPATQSFNVLAASGNSVFLPLVTR